jgi:hypothetical protein
MALHGLEIGLRRPELRSDRVRSKRSELAIGLVRLPAKRGDLLISIPSEFKSLFVRTLASAYEFRCEFLVRLAKPHIALLELLDRGLFCSKCLSFGDELLLRLPRDAEPFLRGASAFDHSISSDPRPLLDLCAGLLRSRKRFVRAALQSTEPLFGLAQRRRSTPKYLRPFTKEICAPFRLLPCRVCLVDPWQGLLERAQGLAILVCDPAPPWLGELLAVAL